MESAVIQRTPWFKRAFTYTPDVAQFPNILERLYGTPARLDERIGALPPDIRATRFGDAWSAQENAGHLLDLEEIWAGRLQDFLDGAETLRPADLTNRKTHEAQHNQHNTKRILNAFRAARLAFVARMEGLSAEEVKRTALHPRLKTPMRLIDLAVFVAEHDDHHLARIAEIVRHTRA